MEEDNDFGSLFVGDLTPNETEENLKKIFGNFGEVSEVKIKRDPQTHNSLGYGFVTMKNHKDALNAKEKLHGEELNGRKIRIGWAEQHTNLFIGDLDSSVTDEQLRKIFSKFGPIYEHETFVKNGKYGFVRFKHAAHAKKAKNEMNGQKLGSRPIRIGWGSGNIKRNTVHFEFDPRQANKLTAEKLKEKFAAFGQVITIQLPQRGNTPRGFGFVHYSESSEGEESAAQAIQKLDRTTIEGVEVRCHFGKKVKNQSTTSPNVSPQLNYSNYLQYYPKIQNPSHFQWNMQPNMPNSSNFTTQMMPQNIENPQMPNFSQNLHHHQPLDPRNSPRNQN
ncbi:trivet isoform i [Anaeramoeba ignava]|uniref:Trivet isoform i n=1 Tax=Anaeramoeba ignava TaxID=1746090 RepID=A0A9Q0LTU0_ANAIG|nr:trivet isoform i [Anaeramoeba ignava]|eukprot:Anaeramoba_ignava/a352108_270.p1 GENE.a352108_270~~a352108_270.p1  ORF type:complete len:334 (-),score=107.47 a352108_270:42-1043(-)